MKNSGKVCWRLRMIISKLRKNIGTIIAAIGFVLLCIITFGDLGELMSDQYWANVKENITSIGFMSISLTLIQVAIKQGLAEQALQRGLNTENTAQKYKEHRELIKSVNDRQLYLPYFLQIYNKRHTELKKREFLINNNYVSEKILYASQRKRLIHKYEKIRINVTAGRIKWATTDIVYNKQGQILTLAEYRSKRTIKGIVQSLIFMLGATFLTRGLFFSPSTEPLWQKFVKLFSYILCIAVASILNVIKDYEKGAFGVPNDLEEINEIWQEFKQWEVPTWVVKEVEDLNNTECAEVRNEKRESKQERQEEQATVDIGTNIQEEQTIVKDIQKNGTDCSICSAGDNALILYVDDTK